MNAWKSKIKKLYGPIAIFGAGGFLGFNLLQKILGYRKDVFGLFSDPKKNWRLEKLATPPQNVVKCDLIDGGEIKAVISRIKPKTIFNLAAYGAYSTQRDINRIYQTNFNSTYILIEELKKYGFSAYIHAGSQSEYGLNCSGPSEEDELIPNSHYAVSKTAVSYMVKYYGERERLPVVHLSLYSVYGQWEEPSRLIPTLIKEARRNRLPKFVDPNISRDFVYVDDVIEAMVLVSVSLCHPEQSEGSLANARFSNKLRDSSLQKSSFRMTDRLYGEVFNVCTGKRTTIKELAYLTKKIFKIKEEPRFGTMKNRDWDLKVWYGNPKKIQKVFSWKAKTSLKVGLENFFHRFDKTQ